MPPFMISGPPELLSLLACVAVLWTLCSVLVVFLCLRQMIVLTREFSTKAELANTEHRLAEWLKDTDRRHKEYVTDAHAAREKLQHCVQTLSEDVHGLLGEMRAQRRHEHAT